MKKLILLLIILPALVYTAKAQLGYNYAQYSLGVGISNNKATTDVPYQESHPAFNFNINYNYTPFITFGLNYEFGELSGGYSGFYDKAVKGLKETDASYAATIATIPVAYALVDPYFRDYINRFQSIALHADVQFGELIDYENAGFIMNAAKNIYVGTGLGMVYNNITAINRNSPDGTTSYAGADHSNNVIIPVRIGYQFKIYNSYNEPNILLNLGYQKTFAFGTGLDGYSDPLFTTRKYETYGGFQIGIKFNFGSITSYRKAIN